MNKKILTINKIMENMTYDGTNICFENSKKPFFTISNEGLMYKQYKLIKTDVQPSTILTNLCNDSCFNDVQCYDENGEYISIINPNTDDAGIKHYTIDISYWSKHDKIKICCIDADNEKYEKYYTKKEFFCNIPKYNYKIKNVTKNMDDILKDTNLLFVETNYRFVAVEAKLLHLFLNNIAKDNIIL